MILSINSVVAIPIALLVSLLLSTVIVINASLSWKRYKRKQHLLNKYNRTQGEEFDTSE